MISAVRMVQRNGLVYRHAWRGSACMSFLQPTLFLLAMGTGVGALMGSSAASVVGGFSYLQFLAPGLLAASCMQTATFESSFPVTAKMTWNRNYAAIAATPMSVADIVLGEVAWIGLRQSLIATAFACVMLAFGVPTSWLALLALPAAVLTGVAFSAPIMAYAATLKSGGSFSVVFRFVISPLFLFSGVFVPVSRFPEPLQTLAWLTPLFHGVELVRGLMLGTIQSPAWIIHVAYLLLMLAIGIAVSFRTFGKKLRA
jgi:lipooligosaccharide transport system permease protein